MVPVAIFKRQLGWWPEMKAAAVTALTLGPYMGVTKAAQTTSKPQRTVYRVHHYFST